MGSLAQPGSNCRSLSRRQLVEQIAEMLFGALAALSSLLLRPYGLLNRVVEKESFGIHLGYLRS